MAGMAQDPDIEGLAEAFLDLWQDQLAAVAADPELAALWQRLFSLWGAGAAAYMPMAAAGDGRPAGSGNAPEGHAPAGNAPAGAAAAAAAPDVAGGGLDDIARRLAAIEERLAALEAAARGARGKPRAQPRRAGRRRA
ncbi:MAG: hypothetical protein OHK0024_04370 [Thalassobaculales bacterium]